MTLDLTKWNASTDGDLTPRPVCVDFQLAPWGSEYMIECQVPSLLMVPTDPDDLDIYYQNDANPRLLYRLRNEGAGLTPLDVDVDRFGAVSRLDPTCRLYEVPAEVDNFDGDTGQREQKEWFAWGPSTFLWIRKSVAEPSPTNATTHVYVPYSWIDKDLAEIIFALTRHQTTGGTTARDQLSYERLVAYSTRMLDIRYRQRFALRRKVRQTIGQTIEGLVGESSAISTWGSWVAGAGLKMQFGLLSPLDIQRNTTIFQHNPDNAFHALAPVVTDTDRYILNRLELRWGDAVQVMFGNNYLKYYVTSPGSPGTRVAPAEIVLEDATSVAGLGQRGLKRSKTVQHAVDRSSAVGDFRIERLSPIRREVTFSLGPRHLEFNAGDLIHVRDDGKGLTGAEDLLVVRKAHNLDTMIASVTAIEHIEPATELLPTDVPTGDFDPALIVWYRGDAGLTTSGSNVTGWADQGPGARHATALGRGAATPPTKQTAYRAGKDCVKFQNGDLTPAGLDIAHFGSPTTKSNWTLFLLADLLTPTAASFHFVLDTAGDGGGSLAFVRKYSAVPAKFGFYDGTAHADGPQDIAAGWHLIIWHCETSNVNNPSWLAHGRNSSWCWRVPLAGQGPPVFVEGPPAAGALDYNDAMRAFGGDTAFGCSRSGVQGELQATVAEAFLFQHEKYHRQLLPHELDGLIRGLLTRWAFANF